jgi:hypothetical protein
MSGYRQKMKVKGFKGPPIFWLPVETWGRILAIQAFHRRI